MRTVRQIPRANALGIWLPVSHAPSCIVITNPSRIGLNPLNKLSPLVQFLIWNQLSPRVRNEVKVPWEETHVSCHLSLGQIDVPINRYVQIWKAMFRRLLCRIDISWSDNSHAKQIMLTYIHCGVWECTWQVNFPSVSNRMSLKVYIPPTDFEMWKKSLPMSPVYFPEWIIYGTEIGINWQVS